MTITEVSALLKSRQLSPVDLTRSYLARIERLNPTLNAFITILPDEALQSATRAEREIAAGEYRGPLHGVPVAVKDIFATAGHRTTCGSKILKDNVTDYDATAVSRLKDAGAILLGKLSTWEFALGDDVNPLTGKGPTRNPWNLERSTDGSSSGSGAAVAADLCGAALGTDTGGSIRGPAAFNGIVGLKPTFGRVSRHGVTPLSWSLDHVGPMTKSVEDNALVLEVIAGTDPRDRWCSSRPAGSFRKDLTAGVKGLRLGLPKQFFFEYVTQEVGDAVHQAARQLQALGASLHEVELPHLRYANGVNFAILCSEALAYHSRYLRQNKAADYTGGLRTFLDVARYISAADYVQAQRIRTLIIRDFENAFRQVDAILAPGGPSEATPLTDTLDTLYDLPVGRISLWDAWRIHWQENIAAIPAIGLPCGFSKNKLPLSLAVFAKHFDEDTVYRVAYAYEQATEWHTHMPSVGA